MFLATTALSEFWDKNQEILFLSHGCLLYDRRHEWESLNHQILPSPWDDRERFSHSVRYLDEYYENLLDQLTEYLNAAHQVSYSSRYWRVVIGPWLFHHLQASYDRYVQLTCAFEKYPELETKTLAPQSFRVMADTWEYVNHICHDTLNLQLYSQLLRELGYSFPTGTLRDGWPDLDNEAGQENGNWLGVVRSARNWSIRLAEQGMVQALSGRRQVALCDMYLPRSQTWRLAWRSGFRSLPLGLRNRWPFAIPGPAFDRRRNGVAHLTGGDEFKSLFLKILPENFPTLYLEGYAQARSDVKEKFQKVPPVMASLVGWYFNEPFKFLAGEVAENGGRLVAAQHGGCYGALSCFPSESHEARIADSYMVWGWADGKSPYQNLPSPKLSCHSVSPYPGKGNPSAGSVLLVSTAQPRFLIRFHSFPVGGQCQDYIEWQIRFLEAIPEKLRRHLRVRPFVVDRGWNVRQRISDRFREIRCDASRSFRQAVKDSRLVVHDHPITTFWETMEANVPTIGFWDPKRWEMREEAEPHFQRLRDAGVVWCSPEDAAAKTAAVFEDPWQWWGSLEVQDARREFVDRYAYARKDWASCWAAALAEEAALSRINA